LSKKKHTQLNEREKEELKKYIDERPPTEI